MFVVTEEDEAAIRAVYEQQGEFAAALELRQRFPWHRRQRAARACARTIASWKPLRAVERTHEGAAVTSDRLTGNRRGSTLIARELASSSPSDLSFMGTVLPSSRLPALWRDSLLRVDQRLHTYLDHTARRTVEIDHQHDHRGDGQ